MHLHEKPMSAQSLIIVSNINCFVFAPASNCGSSSLLRAPPNSLELAGSGIQHRRKCQIPHPIFFANYAKSLVFQCIDEIHELFGRFEKTILRHDRQISARVNSDKIQRLFYLLGRAGTHQQQRPPCCPWTVIVDETRQALVEADGHFEIFNCMRIIDHFVCSLAQRNQQPSPSECATALSRQA